MFSLSPQEQSETVNTNQTAVGSPMTGKKKTCCHALILLKLTHLSELKFTENQMMRIQLLGRSSGLLLQERLRHNIECVKVEAVSVVRLHLDDKIFFCGG